ncbi:MAG: Transcriptional repressor NrdR, partial [Candidatus Gottesmanbacteria bacterium GW2011_GWC2_42_8]
MKCPFCNNNDTEVVETRDNEDLQTIRRRRECPKCTKRFTTYERIERVPLIVMKKDGRKEQFDRDKLKNGILKSCEKTIVGISEIDSIAEE